MAVLGAGAALAITSATSTHNAASNTPAASTVHVEKKVVEVKTVKSPTLTVHTSTPVAREPTPTPAPTPNATASSAGALNAVNEHWHDIETGDYSGAWELESASLGGEEASWVKAEEESGVESVSYNFEPGSSEGSEAVVNIVHLQTVGRANGCQSWTGSYGVSDEGGSWRISQAHLESHSC